MDVVVSVGIGAILVLGLALKLRKARAHVNTISATPSEQFPGPEKNLWGPIDTGSASSESSAAQAERASPSDSNSAVRTALVTVLESYDSAEVLVAKSLLEAADIPYYAKGEAVQDLIGSRLWGGCNFAIGPVALQVPAELAEEARALLEDLERPA